ncbi:MAG: hypothetical protein JSR33_10230 [Proteobacteria bacterium]|nr:hypothetical protein [Pseudomonadota bacterium]
MFKFLKIAIFSLGFAMPTFAFAVCEQWSVTLQQNGNETGVWNFQGSDPGEMLGNGTSTDSNNGHTYTYSLDAFVEADGRVTVNRTQSSDGNNCTYTGQKTGNTITGTYVCNKGDGPWKALVSYCLPKK